jgi:hypothetical protein
VVRAVGDAPRNLGGEDQFRFYFVSAHEKPPCKMGVLGGLPAIRVNVRSSFVNSCSRRLALKFGQMKLPVQSVGED